MGNYRLILCGAALISGLQIGSLAWAGDGSLVGTVLGAGIGGLVGSQFGKAGGNVAATGIGVIAGGVIGNNVGQEVDNDSFRYAGPGGSNYTIYSNDPSPIVYNRYAPNYVAPPSAPPIYVDQEEGTYCRPYSQEIRVDGHVQESYGTACLQSDGSWRIIQ